jgi:hypothetical protein
VIGVVTMGHRFSADDVIEMLNMSPREIEELSVKTPSEEFYEARRELRALTAYCISIGIRPAEIQNHPKMGQTYTDLVVRIRSHSWVDGAWDDEEGENNA